MSLKERVIKAWKSAGMTDASINEHLSIHETRIKEEEAWYCHTSDKQFIMDYINEKYDTIASDQLKTMTFELFCDRVGVTQEAVVKWKQHLESNNFSVSNSELFLAIVTYCIHHNWDRCVDHQRIDLIIMAHYHYYNRIKQHVY